MVLAHIDTMGAQHGFGWRNESSRFRVNALDLQTRARFTRRCCASTAQAGSTCSGGEDERGPTGAR